MSLFGKILAIFNVLAAIAFLSVTVADYSKRTQWSYSHFRHQVLLHGLPVNGDENSWRLPGRSIKSDLTANTLNDMFNGVMPPYNAPAVRTQVEELDALQGMIKNELQAAGSVQDKVAVLAKYLIPIQTTGEDRAAVIEQLRAAKDDAAVEALTQKLLGTIQAAGSDVRNDRKRDLQARRESIADLLYNILPTREWHSRVQTVVGLEQYTAAANRQADRLQHMAQRLKDAIADERSKFVKEYLTLLPELDNLNKDLKRYEAKLEEQKAQLNRYTTMKNARAAEVAELQQQIQAASRTVANETQTLHALQERLFAAQRALADAQAENLRLEQTIRATESGK
jgi:chromosome segregation ATPase